MLGRPIKLNWRARYAAYFFIGILGLAEFILGVFGAAKSVNSIALFISLVVGLITAVAMVILCVFNDRPQSDSFFTKTGTHAATLFVIAQIWFPTIIVMTASTFFSCRRSRYLVCDLTISATVFSYLICAISTGTGTLLILQGNDSGFGENVARDDVRIRLGGDETQFPITRVGGH